MFEELLHAAQTQLYTTTEYNTRSSNMEFESKFVLELLNKKDGGLLFAEENTGLYNTKIKYNNFKSWLSDINTTTLSSSSLPTNYWFWAKTFRDDYASFFVNYPNHPYMIGYLENANLKLINYLFGN